jgi:DNA-binding transcriptional MerR regulator
MSRTSGEGTKIAQAAKELNVTSVTIRRYISEFNIDTTTDDNGVKVLPGAAMEELREIRKLKDEGLTNPRVLEILEERRAKQPREKGKAKEKAPAAEAAPKSRSAQPVEDVDEDEEEASERRPAKRSPRAAAHKAKEPRAAAAEAEEADEQEVDEAAGEVADLSAAAQRSKHSLTCQTCGKAFEHMNPRLRDCLDCYRTKRRERRRGSADRHKSVIQHPLAQQAASKSPTHTQQAVQPVVTLAPAVTTNKQTTVRNYRKAIEETRLITANLKRRLERPDLAEGERRWLEQVYAYQLILHQGWRHLAEYKAQGKEQAKTD